MKEPNDTTTTIVDFDQNGSISIKARRDDNDMNPSGWSIIAFAPSASIRCVRAHQERHLDLFIKSILALAGIPEAERDKPNSIKPVASGKYKDGKMGGKTRWVLDDTLNRQEYITNYEATEEAIHKITSNSFR